MKTLGLIGGMSWESSIPYYRQINEAVRHTLGGLHSAKIILFSVDFHEIEVLQRRGDWDAAGEILAQAAQALERAGADAQERFDGSRKVGVIDRPLRRAPVAGEEHPRGLQVGQGPHRHRPQEHDGLLELS